MAAASKKESDEVKPFRFSSYGVRIEITSNVQEVVDRAAAVARRSLLDNVELVEGTDFDHHFVLSRSKGGNYRLEQDGQYLSSGRSAENFFKFFDSILRVAVAEYAVDKVFLHAGVVGWNGKAIIFPADSFNGKSTLVTELVRNGATYYSDEFAILDGEGRVHPFARPISRRTEDYVPFEIELAEIGGRLGTEPLPVGMVLLTKYHKGVKWSPVILTAGQGVLGIIPFTLSIRYRADFALSVLHKVASHAIIASGRRGSAEKFAKTLLNFVDNNVN